ncbi:DUF983 domain-containing protein [Fulvivirga ulvae]|uniref:DUF983 domain-containing protein n=1 Tax=Fulvivirga ulvae TaxID=2904245 RepID=UPI001F37629B|nr:DUF983 domain-containing protein [Fulvivirga ulvae]UII32049.1 DUF983 domain-containing protein [Fulvivirga ulvae]
MNKAGAIISGKCPRCRKGDIFKTSAFNLLAFYKMHPRCPECDLHYEREPGFFFGAMYISYAFSVAIFVGVGLALSILGDFSLEVYLFAIIGVVAVLLPFLFRYSRILFLHLFGGVRYEPEYKKSVSEAV